MKNLFPLFILLCSTLGFGQNVVFDYDNAGNQVKRYLINIGNKQTPKPVKEIKDIVEADLIKADIYDDLKYYPNPVKEELFLKWESSDGTTVKSMSLYSLNGQLIKTVTDLEQFNTYTFPFQQLPQAIYSLVLNYSNGEKKSLKIIKH